MVLEIMLQFILSFALYSSASFYDSNRMGVWDAQDWDDAYKAEVLINKPIEEVWNYVSDSSKAIEWSIYFHHISPLTSSTAKDGEVGSLRRCYRRADESGVFWDEETLFINNPFQRIILAYNFNGFKIDSPTYTAFVMQSYEKVTEQQTRLTFKTLRTQELTWLDRFVFYFAKYQTEEIFLKNLKNIKSRLELNTSVEPHTLDKYNFFEK
jgi:uncharacterized protein YndB with AHSA1/START domain